MHIHVHMPVKSSSWMAHPLNVPTALPDVSVLNICDCTSCMEMITLPKNICHVRRCLINDRPYPVVETAMECNNLVNLFQVLGWVHTL